MLQCGDKDWHIWQAKSDKDWHLHNAPEPEVEDARGRERAGGGGKIAPPAKKLKQK
jgi:hypothetical protein